MRQHKLQKLLLPLSIAIALSGCGEDFKDCNGFWDKTIGRDSCNTAEVIDKTLSPDVKKAFGADPNKNDTDGDGLTDFFEITKLYPLLKPDAVDTDNNGKKDSDEDIDGDTLTNLEEQKYGTNPLDKDSDQDQLSDKDEVIIYKSDPLIADTDNDGIIDGRETQNGSNPLIKDADKIVTSKKTIETFNITTGKQELISVSITGSGDLANHIVVRNATDAKLVGQIGRSVDISLEDGIDQKLMQSADITLPFDTSGVNPADISKIAIFTINPATGGYEELPTTVDTVNGTITAKTTHFTDFNILIKDQFDNSLNNVPQTCDLITDPNAKAADVVLVLDSSGSMRSNDPNNLRISAAKAFVTKMKNIDRSAVVDFDDSAKITTAFTSDIQSLNNGLNAIDSNGGTNIGAGVQLAYNLLKNNSGSDRNKIIMLLTDGDGNYDPSLTAQLAKDGIRVFTIGLTGDVNESLLKGIATGTNGGYKQIATADGISNIFTEFASVFGDTGKDTDGDGLTDCQETQGVYTMTAFPLSEGHVITTDPNNPDSDGDDLSDGEELGRPYKAPLVVTATPWAVEGFSDPNQKDGDNDGLSDYEETSLDINPLSGDFDNDGLSDKVEVSSNLNPTGSDTDGDQINDKEDPNPLIYQPRLSKIDYVRQFAIGYFCPGDFDICQNTMTKTAGKLGNAFSPVVGNVYDVLNLIVNTGRGDYVSAGFDFIGAAATASYILPPVGASLDVSANTIKGARILKKTIDILPSQSAEAIVTLHKSLPEIVEKPVVKGVLKVVKESSFDSLIKKGMSEDQISLITRKGNIDLDDLVKAMDSASKPPVSLSKQSVQIPADRLKNGFLLDWRDGELIVNDGVESANRYRKALHAGTTGGAKTDRRYPDYYNPKTKEAREAKTGCEESDRIFQQIAKDKALLSNGLYTSMTWNFFPSADSGCLGPTPKVLQALQSAKIPYIMHLP